MAGLFDSVMQPGPTIAADRERRASKGSRGLLAALGGPMAYAPNPVVSALGNALLGAQYVTGEADPYEGARSLSDMTAMAIGSRLPAPMRNIIVHHGSPHKFDKFDSSKIGTGEGAQSYGHGLYLAESKDVAKSYADTLSDRKLSYMLGGKAIDPASLPQYEKLAIDAITDPMYGWKEKSKWLDNFRSNDVAEPEIKKLSAAWDKILSQSPQKNVENLGNMYKVDLPDSAVAKMLDWDKPLSEQAPEVRKAVLATKRQLTPDDIENLGGPKGVRALYDQSNKIDNFLGTWSSLRGAKDSGEKLLRQQGIPGIRYLDGGSRGAGTGTRNYVVFPGEEGLLNILERNGQSLR